MGDATPVGAFAISIHAPREGCDYLRGLTDEQSDISIHAPREGCDLAIVAVIAVLVIFQSTHPVRGAT